MIFLSLRVDRLPKRRVAYLSAIIILAVPHLPHADDCREGERVQNVVKIADLRPTRGNDQQDVGSLAALIKRSR